MPKTEKEPKLVLPYTFHVTRMEIMKYLHKKKEKM